MRKIKCEICHKKCSGDALRANNKFYHIQCFTCKACQKQLNGVGFFIYDNNYYCPEDYHSKFGNRCPVCDEFVEGEVVDCLGKTFHQQCFKCFRCGQVFSSNQRITETGKNEYLCQKCTVLPRSTTPDGRVSPPILSSPTVCASCNELIHSGQILLALETQWHIWCFKCTTCDTVLHGEYMAKDGMPYCIRDYNAQFGVMCYECSEYIAGKVLQAGDYYFHPDCASCTRCGKSFEEHEEMYMQGDEIWHSRCNDLKPMERVTHDHISPYFTLEFVRRSLSEPTLLFRSTSRSPKRGISYPKYTVDFGKHLTYMYLLPEQNVCSLRQPIAPHPPLTPQYHFPQGNIVKLRKSRISMYKTTLQKLAEILAEQQPRPKSPHMENEEPIELSHYPGARVPEPETVPAIERDDFPAPPYPYAVEELKRRLSSSDIEEEGDSVDGAMQELKIKKAEEELKKIENESSLAKVVASTLEENNKKVKIRLHWDPRSASRTPSAKKLPHLRCRYQSPLNASPSRYVNRPKPWESWKEERSATATIPHIAVPKPGYGLAHKSATLPGYAEKYGSLNGYTALESSGLTNGHSYSTLPSSYSRSNGVTPSVSVTEVARDGLNEVAVLRRSLPDMTKPVKVYDYDKIVTSNKNLPDDVDRCHLERHLSKDEFERIFNMLPIEFYKLPEWKRINLKRKAKLY